MRVRWHERGIPRLWTGRRELPQPTRLITDTRQGRSMRNSMHKAWDGSQDWHGKSANAWIHPGHAHKALDYNAWDAPGGWPQISWRFRRSCTRCISQRSQDGNCLDKSKKKRAEEEAEEEGAQRVDKKMLEISI